jgi:hypothetical protein
MLRHTFVTTMLDAGVDLRDVQIAARHADPRTTCATTGPARTSTATRTTYLPPTWHPAHDDPRPSALLPSEARPCRKQCAGAYRHTYALPGMHFRQLAKNGESAGPRASRHKTHITPTLRVLTLDSSRWLSRADNSVRSHATWPGGSGIAIWPGIIASR